jgi:hypothetical protein
MNNPSKQASIILSVIRVPKLFSNGIFSYKEIDEDLNISPDLGKPKFDKKAMKIHISEFRNFMLCPIGDSIFFHRRALIK